MNFEIICIDGAHYHFTNVVIEFNTEGYIHVFAEKRKIAVFIRKNIICILRRN